MGVDELEQQELNTISDRSIQVGIKTNNEQATTIGNNRKLSCRERSRSGDDESERRELSTISEKTIQAFTVWWMAGGTGRETITALSV
jgi:hypothetical protein